MLEDRFEYKVINISGVSLDSYLNQNAACESIRGNCIDRNIADYVEVCVRDGFTLKGTFWHAESWLQEW